MRRRRLEDWERQALADGVAGGEKGEALAAEFAVCDRYPRLLAQRRGLTSRPRGRPKKEHAATRVLMEA